LRDERWRTRYTRRARHGERTLLTRDLRVVVGDELRRNAGRERQVIYCGHQRVMISGTTLPMRLASQVIARVLSRTQPCETAVPRAPERLAVPWRPISMGRRRVLSRGRPRDRRRHRRTGVRDGGASQDHGGTGGRKTHRGGLRRGRGGSEREAHGKGDAITPGAPGWVGLDMKVLPYGTSSPTTFRGCRRDC